MHKDMTIYNYINSIDEDLKENQGKGRFQIHSIDAILDTKNNLCLMRDKNSNEYSIYKIYPNGDKEHILGDFFMAHEKDKIVSIIRGLRKSGLYNDERTKMVNILSSEKEKEEEELPKTLVYGDL